MATEINVSFCYLMIGSRISPCQRTHIGPMRVCYAHQYRTKYRDHSMSLRERGGAGTGRGAVFR